MKQLVIFAIYTIILNTICFGQTIESYFRDKTKNIYALGDVKGNINYYSKLIPSYASKKDSLAIIYLIRGSYYYEIQEFEKAIKDFTSTISLDSTSRKAYYYRFINYEALDDYLHIIADGMKAISMIKDNKDALADLYNGCGWAEYKLKNIDKAIENYKLSLENDPKHAFTLYNRGFAYDDLGKYQLALDDYNAAIPLFQGDTTHILTIYKLIAADEEKLGDIKKANEYYSKAISFDPKKYHYRANTFHSLGDYQNAVNDYASEISLLKKDDKVLWEIYYIKGISEEEMMDFNKAIVDFNTALNLNPIAVKIYINRGDCYRFLKDYEHAIPDYDRAIVDFKMDSSTTFTIETLYRNRGLCRYHLDDYKKAIEDYSTALKLNDQFKEAYWDRGNAYFSLGNNTEATNDYMAALSFYRDDKKYAAGLYSCLGSVQDNLKKYDEAIDYFTQAINMNPQLKEPYWNRGLDKETMGDKKGACDDFRKAAELGDESAKKKLENCK